MLVVQCYKYYKGVFVGFYFILMGNILFIYLYFKEEIK